MTGAADRKALLMLACSARKARGIARGPAWELYDGRVYQVLKKLLAGFPAWRASLEVLIVSARYSVIRAGDEIESYDDRMTPLRAEELAAGGASKLARLVGDARFFAVHANLGRSYRAAVPGLAEMVAPTPVDWAQGGIGARNARTRAWARAVLLGAVPGR